MKVIIAGGRDYKPTSEAWFWLRNTLKELGATKIVSGGASGADAMGEKIAFRLLIPITVFRAEWGKYGVLAGPKRNQSMADYADACILLPGGRGTADMKAKALEKGLKVIEYKE